MEIEHVEADFTLEPDSELRFEIEQKNRKVIVEVSERNILLFIPSHTQYGNNVSTIFFRSIS